MFHFGFKNSERLKYEACWRDKEYRQASRSERKIDRIEYHLKSVGAKRIVDLGVGTGRAAQILINRGFDVLGVDIAYNCLDDGIDIPLVIQPLWEELNIGTFDAVMCFDVLEHIPTELVSKVISNIERLAPHGYLNIGLKPERLKPVHEPLHLTLRSTEWWNKQIRFADVEISVYGSHAIARY